MKITNVTNRPREIAATGQVAAAGATVEVDRDLGERLCRQTRVWRDATPAKKSKSEKEGDR